MNLSFLPPWLNTAYGDNFWLSPFYYPKNHGPLDPGESVEDEVKFQGDAFSMWVGFKHMCAVAPVVGLQGQSGEFTIQLSLEDRNLSDGALDSRIFGESIFNNALANSTSTGQVQDTFPCQVSVKPGGYLKYTLVNGTLADALIVLHFVTVKFYPRPGVSAKVIESERQRILRP
jgi:hypothetical protein